ncbi:MAG: hypothetical protein F6K47_20030 [Symploca sp. SIO2E6]|nr:hypothetical protein [Symploca sp. SIO2E6]
MILYLIEELEKRYSNIKIDDLLQGSSIPWDEELLKDQFYGNALKLYILLSYSPVFCSEDPVEIFYNRYYWFMTFVEKYKLKNGDDAGLEQQAFQLLEEVDGIDADLDWNILEQLNTQAIQEVRSPELLVRSP